jgi:TetR/AcrR family transcriptional regulator
MAPARATRTRDADRSREAILAAAERLFARHGYDGVSLADIGVEAGVSRATPSYFFGSKEELYVAVLERLYVARNAALAPVFAPLRAWAEAREPGEPLRRVLARCVDGYLAFLHGRPTYVQLIEREALAGGDRLAALEHQSTVMEDAFGALSRRARAHGLRRFDAGEAVTCLVALGFLPVAHRTTILRRQGVSMEDPKYVARRKRHIVDVLLHVVGAA